MANDEFASLQAAEKKLQALKDLKPKEKFYSNKGPSLTAPRTLGY